MRKKNKRYLLYYYSGYERWYGFESEPHWYSYFVDRAGLVIRVVEELKRDPSIFEYFTDDLSKIPDRITTTPNYSRPGVKYYNYTYHKVFCVKVIKGGKEYPIDSKAILHLKREANSRLKELSKPRKFNHSYRRNRTSWKKQYKCKHQWEIHQRKRVYVSDLNMKTYDSSWENLCAE